MLALPEREHEFFLAEYRSRLGGAYEPSGYKNLDRFLRAWAVRAVVVSRPGWYEEADSEVRAIRSGSSDVVPLQAAVTAELARR